MKEIERKFLLKEGYQIEKLSYTNSHEIEDLYISDKVRIRNKDKEHIWILTFKSEGNIERDEFEMPILVKPRFDNIPILEKVRLDVLYMEQKFEINIFKHIHFRGKPLVLIEIELNNKNQELNLPEWVGEEVTYDKRFYGYQLANFLKFEEFCVVK